jgi:hypothetical protein
LRNNAIRRILEITRDNLGQFMDFGQEPLAKVEIVKYSKHAHPINLKKAIFQNKQPLHWIKHGLAFTIHLDHLERI